VALAECHVSLVTIFRSRSVTYSRYTRDQGHVTSTTRVMKPLVIYYFLTDGRKQLSFFIKHL